VIDELVLVLKLKKAADRGRPLVLNVYPDGTFDLLFPERVFGDTVEYYDPRRGETRVVIPRHIIRRGRVSLIVVPSGFLESVGFEGLALLALPDDVKREAQYAVAEKLAAVAKQQPAVAIKVLEALGIEYTPPSPEELRENPELAELKAREFEEALTRAREKITSSFLAAATAATVMKRYGVVAIPSVELTAALERAAEIFDVKPEEVLFAERLKMQGVIADILGKLAYYRRKPLDWKRLLALAGIAVLVLVLLLLLPGIIGGFQRMGTVRVP
jgi:hypothetical protein